MAEFQSCFVDNILELHVALRDKTYQHGSYHHRKINDPKPRDIHVAPIRDRLVHHAIHQILYTYFDRHFIFDSYSSRHGKGTHKAMNRFNEFARQVSYNHMCPVWVLKCDIRKFFANIDHRILKSILAEYIFDPDALWLINHVIDSFHTEAKPGLGLPLGNLTSQLLVNVYMNQLDQFVKRDLKAKYYIRFADDFVILHENRTEIEKMLVKISEFLEQRLKLSLHPNKVFIKTFTSGVDFLGWVHFPKHRVLRTSTKKRIAKRLVGNTNEQSRESYRGMLSHGNAYKLMRKM